MCVDVSCYSSLLRQCANQKMSDDLSHRYIQIHRQHFQGLCWCLSQESLLIILPSRLVRPKYNLVMCGGMFLSRRSIQFHPSQQHLSQIMRDHMSNGGQYILLRIKHNPKLCNCMSLCNSADLWWYFQLKVCGQLQSIAIPWQFYSKMCVPVFSWVFCW